MSLERRRNPRGEGDRLREEILGAAIGLVDDPDDPGVLTLRGVARRAGISAPSIYVHFANLDVLTDTVLARSFEELRSTVADAVGQEPAGDPVRRLVAAGRAYVQFGWARPARYRLMFSADGYAGNAIETFAIVERLIGACADAGRGTSDAPRLDAWMVWAGLHGVATLQKPARTDYLRLGTLDRPAMLEAMILRLARIDPR